MPRNKCQREKKWRGGYEGRVTYLKILPCRTCTHKILPGNVASNFALGNLTSSLESPINSYHPVPCLLLSRNEHPIPLQNLTARLGTFSLQHSSPKLGPHWAQSNTFPPHLLSHGPGLRSVLSLQPAALSPSLPFHFSVPPHFSMEPFTFVFPDTFWSSAIVPW